MQKPAENLEGPANALSPSPLDRAGQEAAILSMVEVGLGALLHGLKIPLSGQFLSLNQSFLLTRAVRKSKNSQDTSTGARILPSQISLVAAILKSLAPAGKKLTPMLAISAQGLLFNVGTLVLGSTQLGVLLGAALSSVWAFAQPLLLYWIIFGDALFVALDKSLAKILDVVALPAWQLQHMLMFVVSIKMLLALVVALCAWHLPTSSVEKYFAWVLRPVKNKKFSSDYFTPHTHKKSFFHVAKMTLKDVLNPLFLLSLGLTFLFFVYTESSKTQLFWVLLRPLAIGFLVFFLLRWISFELLLDKLEKLGARGLSRSVRVAIENLQKF